MIERGVFFTNRRNQRLFGVLCTPRDKHAGGSGIVLCPPLAEDFVMGYRAYTVWARRFAIAGVPSLRFHYAGCGNSDADAVDVRLSGLVADVDDACEFLRQEYSTDSLVLAGTRLGASLALIVAGMRQDIAGMSLHSPVVSGSEYWNALLRGQQIADVARGKRTNPESATAGYTEVFADRWSNAFVEDLRDFSLLTTPPPATPRVQLSAVAGDRRQIADNEALTRLWEEAAIDVTQWHADERPFWVARAMQDNYIPEPYLERSIAWTRSA